MYKDFRFINAGENEFYRWGHKAQDKVKACMIPNEKGFYSIPADGDRYWTIGTSEGKYGEFAKFKGEFLSVNKAGYVWAKVGTDKERIFLAMCEDMLKNMDDMKKRDVEEDEEV